MSLSEGGFAVVGDLSLEQGDPIRMLAHPGNGAPPIKISGIVWNDIAADGGAGQSRLRRLGCVVSDPPRSYLALLDQLDSRSARPEVPAVPIARPRASVPDALEPDLPRLRELPPPPKPEPEESLPYFRVRMKQIGGPRTRILTVRARSGTQAESLAHQELAQLVSGAEGWVVLHISRVARP